MFSSSRGILYTAPPADEETRENRTAEADAESPEVTPTESASEPSVEDTPAASDANWTGSVHADD